MDEATIISLFAESPSPSPSSRKATLASATVLLSQRREGNEYVMLVYFCSEKKKNFCKAVIDPHSIFCFIVIAIVFSFQWSPSIRQCHDGPRRTRQRSADIVADTGGWSPRDRELQEDGGNHRADPRYAHDHYWDGQCPVWGYSPRGTAGAVLPGCVPPLSCPRWFPSLPISTVVFYLSMWWFF